MAPPALITAADAAWWTGRPVGTIWRWASEGRIAVYGKGKEARYDAKALPKAERDEFNNLITPAPPPPLPEGRAAA